MRPGVRLRSLRTAVAGAVWLAAAVATTSAIFVALGTPPADVEQLAVIMGASGAASLLLGALAVHLARRRSASLRWRLALVYGVGVLLTAANVVVASLLMFISGHDLTLLLVLLFFGTAISFAFGYRVTGTLVADLAALAGAARRLAAGDLRARAGASGVGEIAHLSVTFNQMADQLQAAFERERALDAGRREMVAAVSHDLRTPLTTIRAMVEAITDGVVAEPEEIKRYLHLMRGEVQHLSRLIDDLFELSQIESGALKLDVAPTRLQDLLAETIDAYQAPARDGRIRLEYETEPQVPPVAADPARLVRVVRNLVDNALSYTPAGGAVRLEARAQGDAVRVTVSDTGPGLSPEDAERVFDRFYRGAGDRSRAARPADGKRGQPTGAGLGLTIARGLIQAHGGRIWVERSAGRGATFHFTLPVAAT